MKTYKYRLYPTKAQKQKLDENLNLCRVLYNTALSQRKTAYRQQRISLNYYDQASELKEVKECLPEYKYIHSQVLQDVLKRVDKAFQNFFRRVKLGEKPGYPHFPLHVIYLCSNCIISCYNVSTKIRLCF